MALFISGYNQIWFKIFELSFPNIILNGKFLASQLLFKNDLLNIFVTPKLCCRDYTSAII